MLTLLVLLLLAFALIGVLSVTTGTPVSRVRSIGAGGIPEAGDTAFARTIELYTGTHLLPGNEVQVLLNGQETYATLWRDLRGARRAVTMQMYYAQPGAVADSALTILSDKAREGVPVFLLLDAFGAGPMKGEWVRALREAGVLVAWLRPLRWYSLHRASQRSHVRVVVIDGEIGYTGGFGLADYWQGDGVSPGAWRETNVRFRGPAVAQLSATFAAGWAEATGELLTGAGVGASVAALEEGTVTAALMHTIPTGGSTPAERYLALTIVGARRTLYVSNSYFVPDDDISDMLVRAVRRGVDVRVLTAGERTDVKITRWAGRGRYQKLLEGGVRIYEYQPAMMHAKTLVADGCWSSVGTMNFDNRSMVFNDESNLLVLDSAIGASMDSLFHADLGSALEITPEAFARRGILAKGVERMALMVSRLL